ncbi:hypothetical protein TIFTF001_049434, partial [Ficus carica]
MDWSHRHSPWDLRRIGCSRNSSCHDRLVMVVHDWVGYLGCNSDLPQLGFPWSIIRALGCQGQTSPVILLQTQVGEKPILIPFRIRLFLEKVNLLGEAYGNVLPPGPHVTLPERDGDPFLGRDVAVWTLTVQPPTTRVESQMFELFVRIRATSDERSLVALKIVRPGGGRCSLH